MKFISHAFNYFCPPPIARAGLAQAAADILNSSSSAAEQEATRSESTQEQEIQRPRNGMSGRRLAAQQGDQLRIQLQRFFASAPSDQAQNDLQLPPRPANAIEGRAFAEKLSTLTPAQREDAILAEVRNGNVPRSLRQFKEVNLKFQGKDGKAHEGTIRVMPDYLAIGSDQDSVRVPMTPRIAQAIADHSGTLLPTRKIVDGIHQQAEKKIAPRALSKNRESPATFLKHDAHIDKALGGEPDGSLTAGHKKDIVLSNRLNQHPNKVAIYGWHRKNGKPIQPLSTVHHQEYVDYSHGVRLISNTMIVDGKERRLEDVMKDPKLSGLVSDEGPLSSTRLPQGE